MKEKKPEINLEHLDILSSANKDNPIVVEGKKALDMTSVIIESISTGKQIDIMFFKRYAADMSKRLRQLEKKEHDKKKKVK